MLPIVPHSVSTLARAMGLALVITLAFLPVAADAWGPFDGSYQLNLDYAGQQYFVYLIALQDGQNLGVVFLAPNGSSPIPSWNYGLGLPAGPGQYQGNTQAPDGTVVGSFNLQFSGNSVVGTTTTSGLVSQASGSRFWGSNPSQ